MEPTVTVSFGRGGWIRFETDASPAVAFIRFEDRNGSLGAVDLFLASDEGLKTDDLRAVPLGLIQTWMNAPDEAKWIRQSIRTHPPVDLRRAASYYNESINFAHPRAPRHWVARMLAAQDEDSGEEQAPMRPLRSRERRQRRIETSGHPVDAKLPVPARRPYGDDFYSAVATTYTKLIASSAVSTPAGEIADANGVPITTAYRWIKEARRRGHLGPGQRGRARGSR